MQQEASDIYVSLFVDGLCGISTCRLCCSLGLVHQVDAGMLAAGSCQAANLPADLRPAASHGQVEDGVQKAETSTKGGREQGAQRSTACYTSGC